MAEIDDLDDGARAAEPAKPIEIPKQPDVGDPVDDDETCEADADDAISLAMHQESNKRLWIKTLMPVMQMIDRDSSHRSDGLQKTMDSLATATVARMKRIIGSDGPG